MKKTGLIVAAAVAVAIPTVAGAAQGGTTRDAITGGGQAFFGNEDGVPTPGAGDTVAFTAKRAKGEEGLGSDAATGQIQVNRRTTGAIKFHGTFDCLIANGEIGSGAGYAYASGVSRDGETPFELYVEDGGKGPAERNDLIMLFVGDDVNGENNDGPCGFEGDFDRAEDSIPLARGNVQVRNRDQSEDANTDSNSNSAAASPLSLLGL